MFTSVLASSLVRFLAPGADASACYPFATRPDFAVAAYANNHDEIGITCIFRGRDAVNPQIADIGTQSWNVRFVP